MAAHNRRNPQTGIGVILLVVIIAAIIGLAVFGWVRYVSTRPSQALQLTSDARQYVSAGKLPLSEVELKATETYLKQRLVEIVGHIGNKGDRGIDTVELYCVFYDPYGQVVLRQRVPIVRERNGGLKPGETKIFRLPFDDVPESWNRQLPSLVIAGIRFSD